MQPGRFEESALDGGHGSFVEPEGIEERRLWFPTAELERFQILPRADERQGTHVLGQWECVAARVDDVEPVEPEIG